MVTLSYRATQKRSKNHNIYYFRTEEDIYNVVAYILSSKGNILSGTSGFLSSNKSAKIVAQEMIAVQQLYHKLGGIRIRHHFIEIDVGELKRGFEIIQLQRIATMMAEYYLYKGFQSVWSIKEGNEAFCISFGINTVSCFDGSKYRNNKDDIYDEELSYLNYIVDTCCRDSFEETVDYRLLEHYPYSYKTPTKAI